MCGRKARENAALIAADGGNLLHPRRNVNFSNNEFNYSHSVIVKMGSVIPQLNPDALRTASLPVQQIGFDPRKSSDFSN